MGGEGSEAALAGARVVPATCLGLHVRRASPHWMPANCGRSAWPWAPTTWAC
jgi:hypothetical protein